jgi:flagellar secretion chaperone FliS
MARDLYLEHRVKSADPLELIHILYEHTLAQVRAARTALARGDIAARTKAITKALAAIGELEGSLNHQTGGAISQNLGRLYQYMRRRLTYANCKKDDRALAEVESLCKTIDEGWTAMQGSISYPRVAAVYGAAAASGRHGWSA